MSVPTPVLPSLPSPRLSVVIVNYNTWPAVATLCRQLLAQRPQPPGDVEIVVVDNHSRPHRLARSLRRQAGVSLRRWGRNRGFGRAVNEGVRLGRGEWVLLLNPDVRVEAGFLDQALAVAARTEAGVGIIGFRLLHGDGTLQPSVACFPTLTSTVFGLLRPRSRRKHLIPQPDQRCEADWMSGCCLLVRRACFEAIQGFDPDFFLYYEDVDLCRRARSANWAIVFEPGITVSHLRPLHRRKVPPAIRLFTRHALLTYAVKHWPRWQTIPLVLLVAIEALARQAKEWRRGERRAEWVFRQVFGMAGDVLLGRFAEARRRVSRVARQEERRVARAVDRHTQPQPARPAAGVPEQPRSVRAGGNRNPRR